MPRLSTYEGCLRYLLGLTSLGIQPGLDRMRRAFSMLGHPEARCPAVIVGGTNGKGSVASMVAGSASAAGLRVGLFTSPHLHRLTERIRIDGKEIRRARLGESLRRVVNVSESPGGPRLTFFETLTAVAADRFAADAVDLAVYEVGLGGRLDATRLAPAKVVTLTSIGMDHERFLGRSLPAIAGEKFALVRRGARVVGGTFRQDLTELLVKRAARARAPCWLLDRDFHVRRSGEGTFDYEGAGGDLSALRLPLSGAHQTQNAAVAVATCAALGRKGVSIPAGAVREGLAHLQWPGRFESILEGRVILDVAHNPAGTRVVRAQLDRLDLAGRRVVLVLGGMRDKNVAGIARPLLPVADEVLLAAPRLARALPPDEFPPSIPGTPMPSVEAAADEALRRAGPDGLVLVTGSSFVVAEARAHLLGLRGVDPSIPM